MFSPLQLKLQIFGLSINAVTAINGYQYKEIRVMCVCVMNDQFIIDYFERGHF